MDRDGFIQVHEIAAALERADASARVLGARARAARAGAGPAAAFAALAATGPGGLVPPVGTGGALAARHLERAAAAAATTPGLLPHDVVAALIAAAATAREQAGGANVLDPAGASRAVRHEVAAVRGAALHAMPRDSAWEAMRIGTFIPRAGWMTALLLACAQVAVADPAAAPAVWGAAAGVAGLDAIPGDGGDPGEVPIILITDARVPTSVAFAVAEVSAAHLALARERGGESAPLAFARTMAARLADPALPGRLRDDPVQVLDELLDAIGALARASLPDPGTSAQVAPLAVA